MTISDSIRSWALGFLLPELQPNPEWQKRAERYDEYQAYYSGVHRRQLKVRPEQADDNLIENYCDLIIERSISLLLGDGIEFELPDEGNEVYERLDLIGCRVDARPHIASTDVVSVRILIQPVKAI